MSMRNGQTPIQLLSIEKQNVKKYFALIGHILLNKI